jgi:hypothetical protein
MASAVCGGLGLSDLSCAWADREANTAKKTIKANDLIVFMWFILFGFYS